MNKLPKMYHSKINKKISNNESTFSTLYRKNNKRDKDINSSISLYQKINNIFKSPKYIYKIDVIIVIDGINYQKRIIGKSDNKLITIDREYIDINKIDDIYIDN